MKLNQLQTNFSKSSLLMMNIVIAFIYVVSANFLQKQLNNIDM